MSEGSIDRGLAGEVKTREERSSYNLSKIDEIGTPEAVAGNYPLGWAQVANTPFRYWKQDANSEGGTHNPLIISYPKGIKDKGGIRTQYSHVIDVLPTTLDLVGIKAPQQLRGIDQIPVEGTSLAYSIDDAKARTRHEVQYYYIFGARSIYDHGWKVELAYPNSFPAGNEKAHPFDESAWGLYNLNDDPTERSNLAKQNPQKLAELKAEFEEQAKSHHLAPYITWDEVRDRRIDHAQGQPAFAPGGATPKN